MQTIIILLIVILSLLTMGLGLYVLVKLYNENGIGHALLGFFFSPYAYIWGWINAKRLQMIDIMAMWTVVTILAVVFPVIYSIQETAKALAAFDAGDFSSLNGGTSSMGTIQAGGQVSGEISDLFEVHNWTFSGTAGQTVTIRANAAGGDSTDPNLNLLGPDGISLAWDDDSGGNFNALISSFTLPANGLYTIQIDVWQAGRYEIILN